MNTQVLIVTPIYPWAGNPQDAVFVRQQVRNLTRAGLECQVLAFRYCPPAVPAGLWRFRYARRLEPQDEEAGFPVHNVFIPRPWNRTADVIPCVADALIDYLERHPPLMRTDVVYAHWLWPGGAAALHLRSRFGWPVVAIARGSDMHHWQTVNRHCRPYVERVIRESDRVLTNCAGLRDEACRIVPDLMTPVDVVYNGCDAQRFAPAGDKEAAKRTLGFSATEKLMLFCGSVIERKGIRNLARAWEHFGAHESNWRLVVVGRLVESTLVSQLKRTHGVTIVGPVPHHDVLSYMHAADAYAQPSIHEGLANATMEAMATGLPVIATDTGGQRELITDGDNGLLVAPEDSAALAAAFAIIANDPRRAQQMGARARETVIRRFSPPAHIATLTSLLRETASRRRASASADSAVSLPGITRIPVADNCLPPAPTSLLARMTPSQQAAPRG